MAQFDPNEYFARRQANFGADKRQALVEASAEKVAALQDYRAREEAAAPLREAALAESYVGKLGLDPSGLAAGAVNLGANVISGTSRLAGNVIAGINDAGTALRESQLTEEDYKARNRITQGVGTPADIARMQSKPMAGAEGNIPTQTSVGDLFKLAEESRDRSRDIRDSFERSSIVNAPVKQALAEQLGHTYDANKDQFVSGVEAVKQGEYLKGAEDIVKSSAKILADTFEVARTNKQGATEYIAENLPQLAIGGFGKIGAALQATGNMGYASDYYNKGIEKYQKENKGALPPEDLRHEMALNAAKLAATEQASDLLIMGAGKTAKLFSKEKDAIRAGFKDSILNTAKAAATGVLTEAPTEAYQTYLEGETSLTPASGKDIFVSGAIGGIVGAGMTGGLRAAAELTGATPERAAEVEDKAKKSEAFKAAVQTNDTSAYLDPKAKTYDPVAGIGVLFGNSQLDTTTPEAKQENLQKANDIVSGLEEQKASLQATYDTVAPDAQEKALARVEATKQALAATDPSDTARIEQLTNIIPLMEEQAADIKPDAKQAKNIEVQMSKLDRQIAQTQNVRDELVTIATPVASTEEVSALVSQADAVSEASPAAADSLINLAMRAPESLTTEAATQLASNTENALTTSQRAYLRAFSEARIAENSLKTMSKVSQEILYGSKKNLGIAQYRSRVASVIGSDNQAAATRQLGMLSDFAKDHAQKAQAAREAIKGGLGNQIVKTASGWSVSPEKLSDSALRKNGGLTLNSGKLVKDIETEAQALAKAQAEMQAAVEMKFGESAKAAVQSKSSAAPTPVKKSAPSSKNPLYKENGEREGIVDVDKSTSTKPEVNPPKSVVTPSTELKAKVSYEESQKNINVQEETIRKAIEADALRKTTTEQQAPTSEASSAPVAEVLSEQAQAEKKEVKESIPSSPSSEPASLTLAGARVAPVPSLASEEEVVEGKPGQLKIMDKATPKGKEVAYTERNLVADYFKQDAGVDTPTGTQRPLATTTDFISAVKADPTIVDKHLTVDTNEDQNAAISNFLASATAWASNIKDNLFRKNPAFAFEDMMQFFLEADNLDIEENVKTAISYAAYSWIQENATRPSYNDDAEINAILNRDEDHLVSEQERDVLAGVGTRQAVVANALGQRITASLGLKAKPNAPRNLQSDLETALGLHAMKLLMDQGILERNTILGKEMVELTSNKDTKATAQFQFVKLIRDANDDLNPQAKSIYEASKGSKGVVDKLFAVEAGLKDPGNEAIPYTQKTTRNTSQKVPSTLTKIMVKENSDENFIRQDTYDLVEQLDPEVALQIAGLQDIDPAKVHKANRDGIKAKNDGLRRELASILSYVQDTLGLDFNTPLFFDHTVWKQQRVGIATNTVNPQTSKIHRFMVSRPSWETTVQINDDAAMDNFRLRAAEGLGVKTDKQSNEKSLEAYKVKLANPAIKAAISVIRKTIVAGEKMSPNDQQVLLAGVQAGGENMHSLDSLIGLAYYSDAVAKGKKEFTVQMMAEVDGVTNGPMLSHLLMGAAETVTDLFSLLNRGGFYESGNPQTQYNLWRDAAGHFDLYETTALHMTQAVQAANIDPVIMDALYAFTGELADKDTGVVQKAGRNIIKTPLTAMVFGSSVNSAVDSMADGFIESIYGAIEAMTTGEKNSLTKEQLLANLKTLGVSLPTNIDLMEREFTSNEVNRLKGVFKETLGEAVKSTMETDFSTFINQRKQFNLTAQMTFDLYNAVYTGMKEQMISDLVKSGEIAVNAKTGVVLHDLTNAQEKQLRDQLADLSPIAHTSMSKDSNELDAGLYISKSGRKLSTNDNYKSTVKFGTPFKDTGAESTSANGYEVVETNPGVAILVMLIHSTDSAISHAAAKLLEVLNIHDAHGAGLGIIQDAARNLNKAVWDVTVKYSPANEITQAMLRTVRGLDTLLKQGNVPSAVLENLAKSLVAFAEKQDVPAEGVLHMQAILAQAMAYRADDMKLQGMEQMTAVDQYAMQGGAYLVTDSDRTQAASLRSGLVADLNAADQAALISVGNKLDAAIKAVLAGEKIAVEKDTEIDTTPVAEKEKPAPKLGEVGVSNIGSDPILVEMFTKTPVMKAIDAVKFLGKSSDTSEFDKSLLRMIYKTINPGLEVRYVTPNTAPDTLLAEGADQSRGWYVSTAEGKEAIYVLSPDFKYSGLTNETLIHELTHASVARSIDQAQKQGKGDAFELVQELETLRIKAQEYVDANKLGVAFKPALTNVQELVAWGMSNLDFQKQVLEQITMPTKTGANKLVTGMRAIINSIVGLLFSGSSKNEQQQAINGMTTLVSNVAGLFNQSIKSKYQANLVLPQETVNPAEAVKSYSTMDIYNALVESNNGNRVSDTFDTHLRELLDGIVTKLHGPFGSFKAALMENQTISETGVFAEAMTTGKAPFASESLAAGFRFTDQEAFVLEQVEATVRAGLEANEGQTSIAYRELRKLYAEVQAKVKPENFYEGVWTSATASEKAEAQNLYDFVFKLNQGPDNRSDYLSRFAALGMTHEGFNTLLSKLATKIDNTDKVTGFNERLASIVEQIISWFAGKMTKTFGGQQADVKLTNLVDQLVGIEAKKRRTLMRKEAYYAPIENAVVGASKEVISKVEKFGKLPFFKENSNSFVRAFGSLTSTVAGDRTEYLMEGFNKFRDAHFSGQQGVMASLVNEVRGSNASNLVFHFMLRMSKRIEALRKDLITNTGKVVLGSFDNGGADLTQKQKEAISYVFLRTDMAALLDHYSMKDLQALMSNKDTLNKEIAKFEAKLNTSKFNRFYKNAGKALAYKMATGKITAEHTLMNAGNIARLYGTQYQRRIGEKEAVTMEAIIDPLVSLYALSYSDALHINAAKEVFTAEMNRKDKGNGVEMILKTHRDLQTKSKELLFDGSEALVMKGYTSEIYNPYMEIVVADTARGEELQEMGYSKGEPVGRDEADPDRTTKSIYTLRDGGLKPHLTGIFSYTGTKAKGSPVHNGNTQPLSTLGQQNANSMAKIAADKAGGIQKMFTNQNFDPTLVNETFMVPTVNANGDVVNYRYMMQENTKDSLLDRDNRPEKILGSLAGSIYDKVSSVEQNRKAVIALHEQFKEDFAENSASYMKVGPDSTDPELREIYRLLPASTKQAIREVWGKDGMQVRTDLLDINFGYRKLSAADAFTKDENERNIVEKLLVMAAEYIWDKKAPLRVRQSEDIWQAVVKATKSNLVVKSWSTLTGNFRSNVSQLLIMGVSPSEIIKQHRIAYAGALNYKKDSAELFNLKHQLEVGMTKGTVTETERRIKILEDSIARNPVKPLIDAGLMPTIVEDVDADDDIYSYKSRFVRGTEEFTNSLNKEVVNVGKEVLMTEDSTIYKGMSYATQVSDFLARYTLYQHQISKKDPMTHNEAIQQASDAFINYDIPTHRTVQYANDSGFVMFTKYYLRIQKMLQFMYRNHPGRIMAILAAENILGAQPTVLDSSMFVRMGNPFDIGAFNYPESLSQLTTVKLLMSPFKGAGSNPIE